MNINNSNSDDLVRFDVNRGSPEPAAPADTPSSESLDRIHEVSSLIHGGSASSGVSASIRARDLNATSTPSPGLRMPAAADLSSHRSAENRPFEIPEHIILSPEEQIASVADVLTLLKGEQINRRPIEFESGGGERLIVREHLDDQVVEKEKRYLPQQFKREMNGMQFHVNGEERFNVSDYMEPEIRINTSMQNLEKEVVSTKKRLDETIKMYSEKGVEFSEKQELLSNKRAEILSLENQLKATSRWNVLGRNSINRRLTSAKEQVVQLEAEVFKLKGQLEALKKEQIVLGGQRNTIKNESRTLEHELGRLKLAKQNKQFEFCQTVLDQFGEQGFDNFTLLATQATIANLNVVASEHLREHHLQLLGPTKENIPPSVSLWQDPEGFVHVVFDTKMRCAETDRDSGEILSFKKVTLKKEIIMSREEFNQSWIGRAEHPSIRTIDSIQIED